MYYIEKSNQWYASVKLLPSLNYFDKAEERDFLSKKVSLSLDLSRLDRSVQETRHKNGSRELGGYK